MIFQIQVYIKCLNQNVKTLLTSKFKEHITTTVQTNLENQMLVDITKFNFKGHV